jgi:MFS family permease
MHAFHDYRLVFWCSLIPASLALVVLVMVVKPPADTIFLKHTPWHWRDAKKLPSVFWQLLGVTFLLMLARFSEAFLTLHAKDVGWSLAALPLLMVGYDIVNALIAAPIGKLADGYNRQKILFWGILVLTLANFWIIAVPNHWGVLIGMLMAGLHMGMTQGLIAALVAENTLPHLRGTAFALYYLTSGTAVLIGNTIAGYLSDTVSGFGALGSTVGAFWGGALFTLMAAVALMRVMSSIKKSP